MAFTVNDFPDLLRLLREHPEWQEELRRLLLPTEIVRLPEAVHDLVEAVRALTEAQRRTEARVEELAEAQRRTEAHVEELAAAQRRTDERLAELAEAQRRTEARVGELAATVQDLAEAQRRTEARLEELTRTVADLVKVVEQLSVDVRYHSRDLSRFKGPHLERRLLDRPLEFAGLLEAPEPISMREASPWLQELVAQGKLIPMTATQIARADLLVRGRRDGQIGHLVVEAKDVIRARDRAALLNQAAPPAWGVVAGCVIPPEARAFAARHGVALIELEE
jgi:archaellum component FlaC